MPANSLRFHGVVDNTMVFGTDRQGFDNSLIKIITFSTHSEVDITIVFGTIMPSSSLGGCTKNPLFLGLSSDFVSLDFFI